MQLQWPASMLLIHCLNRFGYGDDNNKKMLRAIRTPRVSK
jgi:hypothetical protein